MVLGWFLQRKPRVHMQEIEGCSRGCLPRAEPEQLPGCTAGIHIIPLLSGIPDVLRAFGWMIPAVGHHFFFKMLKIFLREKSLCWEIFSPPPTAAGKSLLG